MKKFVLAVISAVVMFAGVSAANADVIWNVTGTFNDGGTLSGTFGIDQYGYLSGYDLLTTPGGIGSGLNYTPGNSYHATGMFYVDAQPGYFGDLHLTFLDDLSFALASNPIIGGVGGPSWECEASWSCYIPDGGPTRYIASGFASAAVPEPITLSLFGSGLAGAYAIRRRRKISAKA
jgi:hypothetical protein